MLHHRCNVGESDTNSPYRSVRSTAKACISIPLNSTFSYRVSYPKQESSGPTAQQYTKVKSYLLPVFLLHSRPARKYCSASELCVDSGKTFPRAAGRRNSFVRPNCMSSRRLCSLSSGYPCGLISRDFILHPVSSPQRSLSAGRQRSTIPLAIRRTAISAIDTHALPSRPIRFVASE